MKRKIILFLLCIAYMFSLTAHADITEFGNYEENSNIYVEGVVQSGTDTVTLIIKNSEDKLLYIQELETDKNGKYSQKFKYNGSLGTDVKVYVNDGGEDISSTLVTAVSDTFVTVDKLDIVNENGYAFIGRKDILGAAAQLRNKYKDADEITLIIAQYDACGKLLATTRRDVAVDFDGTDLDWVSDLVLDDNAKKVKLFAWVMDNFTPVSQSKETRINTPFDTENETVVAMIGSSTTYLGNFTKYLETFYTTRYPNNKIVFVNKGIPGDTANGIVNRMDWDILNSKYTPKPDEAYILVGMNDVGYSWLYPIEPGDGKDHYRKSEIELCIKKSKEAVEILQNEGIEVDIITPALYDEGAISVNASVNRIGANEALSKVTAGYFANSEECGNDVIDLYRYSNEITNEIRKNNQEFSMTSDRIHPTPVGGLIEAIVVAGGQGTGNVITDVSIDVDGEDTASNAEITVTEKTENAVTYKYKPMALPMPYTDDFKKIVETYGYPIDKLAGSETIRVAGLEEGKYTIAFNGVPLCGTYSASELEAGVNIAYDANNPSQEFSHRIYDKLSDKWTSELNIMKISYTEYSLLGNDIDLNDEDAVKQYLGDEKYDEHVSLIENAQSNYAKVRQIESEAKAIAKAGTDSTYTVTISKTNN